MGGADVIDGTQSCPSCGRSIRGNWKHCIYCGATLDGCPQCGAPRQNVEGETYCAECGAPLQSQVGDAPTLPLESLQSLSDTTP